MNLNDVNTFFDADADVEATRPNLGKNALHRSRSVIIEDTDEVVHHSPDDDVPLEETKEEEQVQAEVIDIRHKEFMHLQEGIMGVFYQNESHTRDLLNKLVELTTKLEEFEKMSNEKFVKLEDSIVKHSAHVKRSATHYK